MKLCHDYRLCRECNSYTMLTLYTIDIFILWTENNRTFCDDQFFLLKIGALLYVNSQLRQLTRSDGSSYVAPRAFLDMYNAIWEAENFIYITGWSVNVNIRLVRTDEKSDDERDYSLTVGQLLKKKVRQN